jgi:peptidoglycan/LPS O-acetylase OafA/YrhL
MPECYRGSGHRIRIFSAWYDVRNRRPVLCPLGAALTLPLCARVEHLPGHVVSLLVRWLAVISYSVYLCNLLILQVLMASGRLRSLHPVWQIVLFFAGTLTMATVSYLVVERPFMRLARRLDAEQPQRYRNDQR